MWQTEDGNGWAWDHAAVAGWRGNVEGASNAPGHVTIALT